MADTIQVPTYEQIETMLTKLATNYSNLAILFYDIFYNTTPMDVTFQMYNEAGVLETYTIPNRAKDMANIISGEGIPTMEATKGVLYQDLLNGDLYIKLTSTGSAGWTKFVTNSELQNILLEGVGSPEGFIVADKGTLYIDKDSATLYIKATAEGSSDWVVISANIASLADRDLSNLTALGENHFAKPNFSNITPSAQAMFDAKEDTANKVTTINSSSSNVKFPTAKAVYNFVLNKIANLADTDFSNITDVGKSKFLGNNRVGNGVLSCTTEMYRGTDNSFTLPAGTSLLCVNGLNEDHTIKNEVVNVNSSRSDVIPSTSSANGLEGYIFYAYTGDDTGEIRTPSKNLYFVSENEPTLVVGGVWFKPSTYTYYISKEGSWVLAPIAEIGRWSTNPDGTIKTFEAYKPIQVATTNEIAHVVVEVGGTDDNWYRLYKDGWIEAGGYGSGNSEVTFNKNFKTSNYTFVASGVNSYTKATNKVTIVASGSFDWMAKGWVA